MKVKPVDHRILIQFHFPPEDLDNIVLPDSSLSTEVGEEQRTKVEVIAIGENVTICRPCDFLLLHHDAKRTMMPTSKEPPQALVHDSMVLGIVLSDMRPESPNENRTTKS